MVVLRRLALCMLVPLLAFRMFAIPEYPDLPVVGNPGLHPGPGISCGQTGRCEDYTREVTRWVHEHRAEHLPMTSVTYHGIVARNGDQILGNRSGGNTYIAVVTFGDGHRVAFMVGCGVGLSPDRCFSGTGLS